jgi:hypothetical protein
LSVTTTRRDPERERGFGRRGAEQVDRRCDAFRGHRPDPVGQPRTVLDGLDAQLAQELEGAQRGGPDRPCAGELRQLGG